MAKRTTTIIQPPPPPEDEQLPPSTSSELEDANKLEDFHAEFEGKAYKVRVEKFNKEESAWEIVARVAYDGWDSYAACKPFGGGKYRLSLLNERGKYVEGGRQELRIASVTEAAASAPERRDDNPLNNPVVAMMFKQMESSQVQMTELLKTVLAKPAAEPAQKVPTITELLESLAKLKTLTPGEESFSKKFNEMAGMMEMFDRMRGDRGDGEAGGSWVKEIREGLAAAREMGMLGARRLPAAETPPAAPEPARSVTLPAAASSGAQPPAPAPAAAPQEAAVSNPIVDELKPYAQIFARKAENKENVEETGKFLVDELYTTVCPIVRRNLLAAKFASDDAIVEQIMNRAKDPGQLEIVFNAVPELTPHRAWCEAVIAAAIKDMSQPEAAS